MGSMNDEAVMSAIRQARYKYRKSVQSEASKENQRNWRKSHPEKQKEYEDRFFLKKAIEYGLITEADAGEYTNEIKNKAIYRYQKERGYQ